MEAEKAVDAEKPAGEGEAVEASKEEPVAEPEKEQEDKVIIYLIANFCVFDFINKYKLVLILDS